MVVPVAAVRVLFTVVVVVLVVVIVAVIVVIVQIGLNSITLIHPDQQTPASNDKTNL